MAVAGTLTYKTELDTSGVQKAGSTIKSIIAGLGITKMISMAMSEINASIDGAIARFDTMNNFPKVMSNLGISSEEADKSIKKMSERLAGLPTTLDQGALAVQRLTSSNGDVEKSTDIFLALNNAIIAGGAGVQIQESALEQLSQAYSKGKMDMMEWRTIQMAMPAQLKQIAKAMGVTTEELGEMLRKGDNTKESMDAFMDTIVKLNTDGVDGFQNFETQARNATGGIGTAIIVAKTQIVKGVTDIITALNTKMQSTGIGTISDFIANVGKESKKALDTIAQLITGELSPEEFGKKAIDMVTNFVEKATQELPKILDLGINITLNLINGISQGIPNLMDKTVDLVISISDKISENLDLMVETGMNLYLKLAEGFENSYPRAVEATNKLLAKIIEELEKPEFQEKLFTIGGKIVKSLAIGLIKELPTLIKNTDMIRLEIVKIFNYLPNKMIEIGKNIVFGIWNGLGSLEEWLKSKVRKFVSSAITNAISGVLKIASPSKVMINLAQWIPKGIAVGIDMNTDSVEDSINDMYKEINKTIKMENSKLDFNVVSGNIYNKSLLQTPISIDLNANLEMDSQKVGRLVTPSVTRTIKNGGGI